MKPCISDIFSISSDEQFRQLALSVFRFQATENPVYKTWLDNLDIRAENVTELKQIPFLPIGFFKTHTILSEKMPVSEPLIFTSSGTTGMVQSKHFVSDPSIYEKSYLDAFTHFYGDLKEYCILALLPSYLERDGSSLIYMADDLIKKSRHPKSGFYLHNYEELIAALQQLKEQKQKTILLGVTYALLDITEQFPLTENPHLIVMETGGMKGKRKEMVREELHEILCSGLGVKKIHSEYGMTELLSQAYSKGDGVFDCPSWMKILIRDTNDPFSILEQTKSGGINVIDLANINSCSFIATQDLGKIHPDNSFEVLGRFDNSDIRGCNLLVQ
ncbi:MAG: acyl transferase [Bacteroidetes bacterium]|nr:acyl transferase [Bacteroidota bacterium]